MEGEQSHQRLKLMNSPVIIRYDHGDLLFVFVKTKQNSAYLFVFFLLGCYDIVALLFGTVAGAWS